MHRIFELVDTNDAAGVRTLLMHEPDALEARDETGVSPLAHALYRGSDAAFHAIRETVPLTDPWDRLLAGEAEGLPDAKAWSTDGFTGLHLAAFAHNLAAAKVLLEAGADPNALSRASFAHVTPLGTCAFANEAEVARLLLQHGADPSLAEDDRFTPLAVAEQNGHHELVDLLRAAG